MSETRAESTSSGAGGLGTQRLPGCGCQAGAFRCDSIPLTTAARRLVEASRERAQCAPLGARGHRSEVQDGPDHGGIPDQQGRPPGQDAELHAGPSLRSAAPEPGHSHCRFASHRGRTGAGRSRGGACQGLTLTLALRAPCRPDTAAPPRSPVVIPFGSGSRVSVDD